METTSTRRGQNFVASATHILVAAPAERDPRRSSTASRRACSRKQAAPSTAMSDSPSPGQMLGTPASVSLPYRDTPRSDTNTTIRRAARPTRSIFADTSPGRAAIICEGGIRRPADSAERVPRRAGAGFTDVYGRVHWQSHCRSAGRPADVHDARSPGQPAAAAHGVVRGFVQDSFRVRPDVTLTAGLRYDLTSPPVDVEDRATALRSAVRATRCRSARAACHARVTTRIGTTGRRVSAPPGRWTMRRRQCCEAPTAFITTIRRSRRAKGCTSTRRISIFRRSSRRRSGLITLTDPFPSGFPDSDAEPGVRHSARSADAVTCTSST